MAIVKTVLSGIYTTMKGMMVTGKELFRKPITVQYPFKKREIPLRFRGMLVNDINRCNACTRCARICPVNCIELEAEGKGKDRKCTTFVIDFTKCCWCNLCSEVCPDKSIYMTHEYETVFTDRSKMRRDFVKDPITPDEVDPDRVEETKEKEEEKATSGLSAA